MSMYGRFEFALPLTKAYKSGDGKMHVVGTASDTLPDLHDDRMSEKAVDAMAKQATEGALPLLDNHRATFGFGKTVEGQVAKKGKARELVIDFELYAKYPQSLDLFQEVLAGKSKKQLSIGGMLNLENPNAVRFEEDKKTGRLIRVIDDIILEHIAATRPNQAANERTAFLQAIVKDVLGERVEKTVVPYKKYALVTEERWDWSAAEQDKIVEAGGWDLYRQAHAWFDPEADAEHPKAPEVKGAYKLPHHVVRENELKTHWPGVGFAMGALLGARGGVDVPDGDRRGIYNHLARHYAEFEKEPPEFKTYTREELLAFHKAQGLDLSAIEQEDAAMADETKAPGPEKPEAPPAGAAVEPKNPEPKPGPESQTAAAAEEDAEKGLSFLARLGRLLRGEKAAKRPGPEAPSPVPVETAPAVKALEEALAQVRELDLTEKTRFDLKRLLTLMQRFLEEPEPAPPEATPAETAKAIDANEVATLVGAEVRVQVAGLRKHVEEVLLQGIGALAEKIEKSAAEGSEAASAATDVARRVERLEKVSGVRQGADGQEDLSGTRRDRKREGPFAGIFDGAIAQARRVMGQDDRRNP